MNEGCRCYSDSLGGDSFFSFWAFLSSYCLFFSSSMWHVMCVIVHDSFGVKEFNGKKFLGLLELSKDRVVRYGIYIRTIWKPERVMISRLLWDVDSLHPSPVFGNSFETGHTKFQRRQHQPHAILITPPTAIHHIRILPAPPQ